MVTTRSLAIIGLASLALATASLPAAAQQISPGNDNIPTYRTWQSGWDSGNYDQKHVMLGTVAQFQPYRLTIARDNGVTQTIDLKNGTTILPVGMTPLQNQRVAIVGYYSNGTFVANRVILRQ